MIKNYEVIISIYKNNVQITFQVKSPFSLCLFSPCGNYLAASSTIGQIVVWDVNQQRPLDITEDVSDLNISSMAWNPSGTDIYNFQFYLFSHQT